MAAPTREIIANHYKIDPPFGVEVWDVDPYSIDILKDPSEYYEELTAKGPFVYIPKYSVIATGRYDVAKEVFSDHSRFSSWRGVGLQDFEVKPPWRPRSLLLEHDPPEHTRARKIMSRALSPKIVRGLMETFKERSGELIDEALKQESFDLIESFAEEFATTIVPRIIGMTKRDKQKLIDYAAMVFNAAGPDNDLKKNALDMEPHVVPWITDACKREDMVGDGLGSKIYSAVDSGELESEEAEMLVRSILSAGIDTTVNGIAGSIYCLAQNPDAFSRLKQDSSLKRPFFEEVLRYTSPVHTFYRTSNGNHEVSGVQIEEGTKVMCVLGAANMDPRRWEQPKEFLIERRPVGHLAFGVGIHGCAGQNIARGEVEAMLTMLLEKVETIEIVNQPVWRPNNAIRALDQLDIKFTAK